MFETDFLVDNFLSVPNTFISGSWIQNSWSPVWKLHWSQWTLVQLWKIWEQILRICVSGARGSTIPIWHTTARITCSRAPSRSHRPVNPILFQCSQSSQCDIGLWKWVVHEPVIWAVDLKLTWLETGSHLLIRWCDSGWEISCSGGPLMCFLLSAFPYSTSEYDCKINVSPRRDIKMCSECQGKHTLLFPE